MTGKPANLRQKSSNLNNREENKTEEENEQSRWDLWDSISHLCHLSPRGEEGKMVRKNIRSNNSMKHPEFGERRKCSFHQLSKSQRGQSQKTPHPDTSQVNWLKKKKRIKKKSSAEGEMIHNVWCVKDYTMCDSNTLFLFGCSAILWSWEYPVSGLTGRIFNQRPPSQKWSEVKVTQSCLTLCDPMDYTVYGIL